MTLASINPLRSFRAAYGLFIVMPLFCFASLVVSSWLTMHLAPIFSAREAFGVISFIGQTLLFQALMLLGAGLPTWHWFQQLLQSCRNWRGALILVIAIVHYLVLQWWCTFGLQALSEHV
jgi:hypothetical protein